MINGTKDLTVKILSCNELFNADREVALEYIKEIIAEHYNVSISEVEWRDFRKPGWHIDPPGRYFVKGEPLKLFLPQTQDGETQWTL